MYHTLVRRIIVEGQLSNLVLVVGYIVVDGPVPVFRIYWMGGQ